MALLENIKVFIRVVELGSLSAAGRDMRLSAAVTSHRMKELERYLGVRLFNRTTRQLQPTEQGNLFYQGCLEVLHALEEAEAAVTSVGGKPRGALRVTAPLGMGRRILSPLIPEFHEQFPEIEIRLRLSDHLIDLMREGVDAAVRLAVLSDSSFTMRKICDCERVICASTTYLAKHGTPSVPADMLKHDCLLLRFPGSAQFQWRLDGPDGPHKLSVSGPYDADDGDVLLDWALQGRGLIMMPLFELAPHIRSGTLVPVLTKYPPEPVTLAILYPHRRLLAPKVKAFADVIGPLLNQKVKAALDGMTLARLASN